jgi:hypothetical protein
VFRVVCSHILSKRICPCIPKEQRNKS